MTPVVPHAPVFVDRPRCQAIRRLATHTPVTAVAPPPTDPTMGLSWAHLRRRASVWIATAAVVAAVALVVSNASAERTAVVLGGAAAAADAAAPVPSDATLDGPTARLLAHNARRLGGPGAVLNRAAALSPRAATLIFLHGAGGSGAAVLAALRVVVAFAPRAVRAHLTILAPTAVAPPGRRLWFSIRGRGVDATFNAMEVAASAARIDGVIGREVARGVPASRILVMGYSQGGALALTVALRSRRRLAGCGVAAGFLPLVESYPSALAPANKQCPYYMLHGGADKVVPLIGAERTRNVLRRYGRRVNYQVLRGRGHNLLDLSLLPWVLRIFTAPNGLALS